MSNMLVFNPVQLIEEVQKRPGLYKPDHPSDREEKLALWKEIGAVIFHDWDTCNKATAYDRVLQIQRKWRSLRDAYNRELRARRSGIRINRRTYRYFKRMSFLGGFEGLVSDGDESDFDYQTSIIMETPEVEEEPPPVEPVKVKKNKKKKRRREPSPSLPPDEVEMSMFPIEMAAEDNDSDKLFLLSFLPEMKQLPVHIKMWARAQIANVMQEAVSSHYNDVKPGTSQDKANVDVKRQRLDSAE